MLFYVTIERWKMTVDVTIDVSDVFGEKSLKAMRFEMMSPLVNPLIEAQEVKIKRRWVQSGKTEQLINPTTGEVAGVSAIRQIEEKDDVEFVKVFSDGVKATFGLSRTAARVFQIILDLYQKTPMVGGYADSVDVYWFGDGVSGVDAGMSERTFQRGLKELLTQRFLWPKTPNSFWVNPALFFKGNRVMFIKEYRRKAQPEPLTDKEQER